MEVKVREVGIEAREEVGVEVREVRMRVKEVEVK
jgi:hypothetical protein